MKIWIKYIAGIIIGLAFFFIVPKQNASYTSLINIISSFFTHVGQYSLYPVLFFSFTIGIYELRESKSLLKLGLATSVVLIISTVCLSVIGLLSVLIRNPSRIPIFVEGSASQNNLGITESLMQLFPTSAFEVFTNGSFILPLCILAGFIGAGFAVDKVAAKASLNLFDSLSRVLYAVMTFFVDIISIAMIAISLNWMLQYHSMISSKVFLDLIFLLVFDFLLVALALYPALIRLVCGKVNPYRILYASIAPVLAAFFSGDTTMTLPILLRHSNESVGVRRRISTVTMPIFSIFGRAGTALVLSVSFIVILKSYSSLGLSFQDMVWLIVTSIALSFFLGRFSSGGTYLALATLCALYGRGFEAGHLILKPAAFFLGSVAAALDALTAMVGTFIVAKKWDMLNHRDLRFFI